MPGVSGGSSCGRGLRGKMDGKGVLKETRQENPYTRNDKTGRDVKARPTDLFLVPKRTQIRCIRANLSAVSENALPGCSALPGCGALPARGALLGCGVLETLHAVSFLGAVLCEAPKTVDVSPEDAWRAEPSLCVWTSAEALLFSDAQDGVPLSATRSDLLDSAGMFPPGLSTARARGVALTAGLPESEALRRGLHLHVLLRG